MNAWSVAIIDSGVTDELEATYGASRFAYDYYRGHADTDGDRTTSHGSWVAESIELTNSRLERIDLQISNDAQTILPSWAVRDALTQVINLDDAGWSIGAVNMSFSGGGAGTIRTYRDYIDELVDREIFIVASSGNGGSANRLENAGYPAAADSVISVGSHDGQGNPSWFSQSGPNSVHLLADGENFPSENLSGTSFSAPSVAATVATAQALVEGVTGDRLSFSEVISVLNQGGAGPLSNPDPADGATRYFLHDHDASITYTIANHINPNFSGLEYIASYADIEATFGWNADAGLSHYTEAGVYEGRQVDFDALDYIASHSDLIAALGADRAGGALHYLSSGRAEGRSATFEAEAYLDANPDVRVVVGDNLAAASQHYISHGYAEGRSTSIEQGPPDVIDTDLPATVQTSGYVAVGASVTGVDDDRNDVDWFRTELVAGETVLIEAKGLTSDSGTLWDPELRVYDTIGRYLARGRDVRFGRDDYLEYTPRTTGTHFLEVYGWGRRTGTYTLQITPVGSGQQTTPSAAAGTENLLAAYETGGDPFGLT